MPLLRNLGALTSWNPLGLSRPVMGLLYLLQVYLSHNFKVVEWIKIKKKNSSQNNGSNLLTDVLPVPKINVRPLN